MRTREGKAARMSRTDRRDGGAAAHDGEHAEYRKNKRHSTDSPNQPPGPNTRLRQRAIDWKVGEERVEFTVGPGCVQRFEPVVKLLPAEPSLSGSTLEPFGNLLPIGV
jgi:hypothetical protein